MQKNKVDRIIYTQTWADSNGYLEGRKPLKPYLPRKPILRGDHAIYNISKSAAISYRYIIEQAIKGEPIELWGDTNKGKDIIYVKDLCQMIYKSFFTNKERGIYNAGTGVKTTMQEQIDVIIKVFSPKNKKSKIIYCPQKKNYDNFVMDITNITKDLGYIPEYDYIKYLEDYKKEREIKRFDKIE